ncbi:MAG TPA: RDD family protein [Methylophilaceae bacterium]|nr:RDD family protein [Methylophilaceae bacterium]
MSRPGLLRLLASLFYEALLLLALFFVATFLFILLFGQATTAPHRYYLQLYLWVIAGIYFSWCWSRGRTLPMQAWRIQLRSADGGPVSLSQACMRYLWASAGLLLSGAGFLWALLDRDHLFLHDRLAGTRLVFKRS